MFHNNIPEFLHISSSMPPWGSQEVQDDHNLWTVYYSTHVASKRRLYVLYRSPSYITSNTSAGTPRRVKSRPLIFLSQLCPLLPRPGNFAFSQGNLSICWKSGKSQGTLCWNSFLVSQTKNQAITTWFPCAWVTSKWEGWNDWRGVGEAIHHHNLWNLWSVKNGFGQGKVSEKSGNFFLRICWEPC